MRLALLLLLHEARPLLREAFDFSWVPGWYRALLLFVLGATVGCALAKPVCAQEYRTHVSTVDPSCIIDGIVQTAQPGCVMRGPPPQAQARHELTQAERDEAERKRVERATALRKWQEQAAAAEAQFQAELRASGMVSPEARKAKAEIDYQRIHGVR